MLVKLTFNYTLRDSRETLGRLSRVNAQQKVIVKKVALENDSQNQMIARCAYFPESEKSQTIGSVDKRFQMSKDSVHEKKCRPINQFHA